jgi:hypothetical protein
VLRSETFARADQLKRFLRYICEMEESGRAAEITEYDIGMNALGRPANYSPGEDSGVRVSARSLRQKLERFYYTEAPDTRIRVGLRKGKYTPYYYEVAAPIAAPESDSIHAAPALPEGVTRGTRRMILWVTAVLITLLALAAGGRGLSLLAARQDPIVQEFWGPVLGSSSEVLLCLASPPSLLIKPYHNHVPPNVLPLPPEVAGWYSSLRLPDVGGKPYMYRSVDAPLFGDSAAALKAAQTILAHGGSYRFLPENIVGPAALRNRNVVLIGGPNYSAYAGRILRSTPLTIVQDETTGEEVIYDRSKGAGSPTPFMPKRDESGKLLVIYGLITTFPNQTGAEKPSRAIIISGITGAGAPAAMEFFASRDGLAALRAKLRKDGINHVPDYYQVVVRATRDRAMPLSWDLAGYRVMDRPPTFD